MQFISFTDTEEFYNESYNAAVDYCLSIGIENLTEERIHQIFDDEEYLDEGVASKLMKKMKVSKTVGGKTHLIKIRNIDKDFVHLRDSKLKDKLLKMQKDYVKTLNNLRSNTNITDKKLITTKIAKARDVFATKISALKKQLAKNK